MIPRDSSYGQHLSAPYTPPTPAPDGVFPFDSTYAVHQLPTPPHTGGLYAADDSAATIAVDGLLASRANSPDLAGMAVSGIGGFQELLAFAPPQPDLFPSRRALAIQQPALTSFPDVNVNLAEAETSADAGDEIEEIGTCPPSQAVWISPQTPSSPSDSSSDDYPGSIHDIFRRPAVAVNSPEILLAYFDKNTCGILSVKDGPRENPWRTLIWPMANDSKALYHAVSSMTAFHMCRERPELRIEGMEHMRKSLRFLGEGLSHGNIREDAALGTTLVLAFSEAFDRHTSTGIQHLRGARVLLSQALARVHARRQRNQPREDPAALTRLQFLYNVWVYLDVLASLTSDSSDENDGCTNANLSWCGGRLMPSNKIDSLLGCADTLFPLIAQVAGLVQRARRLDLQQNLPAAEAKIMADASHLVSVLESWELKNKPYEPIEDPSNDVTHCRQTAEAYRWATLLYLRQALPRSFLPAAPSTHELAREVMSLIDSIPASSRSCILHIYPLLVAGCEAESPDERAWVAKRWEGMINRLRLGNVEKAWLVVKEVWLRRDAFLASATATAAAAAAAATATPIATATSPALLYDSRRGRRGYIGPKDNIGGGVFFWDSPTPSPPLPLPLSLPFREDAASCPPRMESLQSKHRKRGDYEYEVSIKGRLHWLGVMKEWNWEGVWSFPSQPCNF